MGKRKMRVSKDSCGYKFEDTMMLDAYFKRYPNHIGGDSEFWDTWVGHHICFGWIFALAEGLRFNAFMKGWRCKARAYKRMIR